MYQHPLLPFLTGLRSCIQRQLPDSEPPQQNNDSRSFRFRLLLRLRLLHPYPSDLSNDSPSNPPNSPLNNPPNDRSSKSHQIHSFDLRSHPQSARPGSKHPLEMPHHLPNVRSEALPGVIPPFSQRYMLKMRRLKPRMRRHKLHPELRLHVPVKRQP